MYISREITKQFNDAARLNNIVVIVGPRQAGKTTFLKEQSKAGMQYVLFDDPDARELFDSDIKRFENQYVHGENVTILDEVQYGKEPGRKLKYLADTGKRLWVTSSSQVALSKEILSWLVGRVAVIKLYPFSLEEFLSAKNIKETTANALFRATEEHMVYGGYPKVVLESDRQSKALLLKNLGETMILKDMARAFQIEDISSLERLSVYLSHYVGNIVIYGNICNDLGISFQSVKKYMDAMEKSYLIIRIQPFYKNKLKEVSKQPKLYFIDTGLRNSIANEFNINAETKGKLFENYVLTELIKAGLNVRYWQTKSKAEVDFVVQKGNEIIPIEVKASVHGNQIERSMHSFIETYSPKRGFVIFNEGLKSSIKVERCNIKFTNITELTSSLK